MKLAITFMVCFSVFVFSVCFGLRSGGVVCCFVGWRGAGAVRCGCRHCSVCR